MRVKTQIGDLFETIYNNTFSSSSSSIFEQYSNCGLSTSIGTENELIFLCFTGGKGLREP